METATKMCIWLFGVLLTLIFALTAGNALAMECYECHGSKNTPDYRPVDSPFRNISSGGFQGNHRTHMDPAATPSTCSKCHPGAAQYGQGHRNTLIDISPNINNSPLIATYRNGSTAFPQRTNPRLGSCSNVNCHFERETPAWGGTAYTVPESCTQCHGSPPNGLSPNYTGGAAGSHATHDRYYSGLTGCARCHTDHRTDTSPFSHATSSGRNLIVAIQNPFSSANGSYSGTLDDYLPSQSNQFGSCNNVYCHSKGDSKTNFVPNTLPSWGTPLPADCTGCHGNGHGTAAEITSGSHTMHVGRDYYGQHVYTCSTCHSSTASGNRSISNTSNHLNQKVDVILNSSFGGTYSTNGHAPGGTAGECRNVYCHSNVQPDGGIGEPTVYDNPVWGDVNSVLCGNCHGADGGHNGHGSGPKMATGSHTKHLSYGFTTTSNTVRCMVCHKYTDYPFITTSCMYNINGNIICHGSGTSSKHANGLIDVRIDTAFGNMSAYQGSPVPGNGYSNCTNTYCHSNGTSIATGAIPPSTTTNWGSGSLACNACHGNPPDYLSGQPKANSHTKHSSFSCNRCHYAVTTTGTTITSTTLHVNKAYNVSGPPATPFTYTFSTSGGTCSANSCHNDGTFVSTGVNVYSNAIWGSSSSCDACHGSPPSYTSGLPKTNSHSKHGYMSCNKCHWTTTQTGNTITGLTAHLNNQYDISNGSGTLIYSYNANGGSCSGTFGCHQPATWGGSVTVNYSDCVSCHKTPIGSVRQVVDSNGDGTGSAGDFKKSSHHVLNYRTITETASPVFAASATADGTPAGFVAAANAYSSDASYATSTVNGDNQVYQHYTITLPGISQVITNVEVGVQAFYMASAVSTSRLYVQVSWDNGITWSTEQAVTLTRNSASTTYLNFASSTAWDSAKLSDANFMVRVRNYFTGTGVTNYLDWLPVRVTYSSYNISHSVTNADCLVCHEVSQHPGGKVRLKDADTGAIYVYNPADPATAENFCLSCHDTNGANGTMAPFSDGKSLGVAPYKAGAGIRTNWGKSFGHKQQGLTCLGNGNPNTGCHSNGHGAENVGMLSQSMAMPLLSDGWYTTADEGSYQACFSCHQNYPRVAKEAVLGYRLGGNYDINGDGPPPYNIPNIMTNFRDRNSQGSGKAYDDYAFWTGTSNLHYFHVQGGSYKYRDMYSSSISCISCHNVHGSNTQWGAVYDEMQYARFNGSGSDKYGRIGSGPALSNFPTSCAFNCHSGMMGTTSNWFEPAGE